MPPKKRDAEPKDEKDDDEDEAPPKKVRKGAQKEKKEKGEKDPKGNKGKTKKWGPSTLTNFGIYFWLSRCPDTRRSFAVVLGVTKWSKGFVFIIVQLLFILIYFLDINLYKCIHL